MKEKKPKIKFFLSDVEVENIIHKKRGRPPSNSTTRSKTKTNQAASKSIILEELNKLKANLNETNTKYDKILNENNQLRSQLLDLKSTQSNEFKTLNCTHIRTKQLLKQAVNIIEKNKNNKATQTEEANVSVQTFNEIKPPIEMTRLITELKSKLEKKENIIRIIASKSAHQEVEIENLKRQLKQNSKANEYELISID